MSPLIGLNHVPPSTIVVVVIPTSVPISLVPLALIFGKSPPRVHSISQEYPAHELNRATLKPDKRPNHDLITKYHKYDMHRLGILASFFREEFFHGEL